MPYNAISLGSAANARDGGNVRAVGAQLNAMLTELYAGVAHARLDISNATLTASVRVDLANKLGIYVGAAGAADGAQIEAVAINKATGALTLFAALAVTASSAGAPSIFPTGDSDTGVFFPAADTVAISTGGTERMRVDPSGLLTTALTVSPPSGDAIASIGNSHPITIYTNPAVTSPAIYRKAGDVLRFGTTTDGISAVGFVEHARIDASGNVNVGSVTTTAQQRLNIAGGLKIEGANPGNHWWATAGGADEKIWDCFVDAGAKTLYMRALNDTFGASSLVWSAKRTGYSIDYVNFGAPVLPSSDNNKTLGSASLRWSTVYAGTGTINTSDGREKAGRDGRPIGKDWLVSPLNKAELRAAQRLASEIGVYKWQDAVAQKGEAARLHIGMTVQRAIEIMQSEGLDPWAYGFICRDEITRRVKVTRQVEVQKTETVAETHTEVEIVDGVPVQRVKSRMVERPVTEMLAVVDETGAVVLREIIAEDGTTSFEPVMHPVPVMMKRKVTIEIDEPAGDRLGFRDTMLVAFIQRGQAENIDALTARIAALEAA